MIGVALKGLAGRKVRALLTAFAVVIGVSMVSGTFILTDTMQKSFDGLFAASYDEDRRRHPRQGDRQELHQRQRRHDPRSRCSTKVRALPEVEAAGGDVSPAGGQRRRHHRHGRQGRRQGEPRRQLRRRQRALQPAQAQDRRLARRARSRSSIDAGTADKQHYEVGDTVDVSTLGKKHTYRADRHRLVRRASTRSASRSIAAWDVKTAQTLLDREGRFDSDLDRREGRHVAGASSSSAVKPLVPGTCEVKDSAKQAKDDADGARRRAWRMIRNFLLGFGGIALLVGAFVIFNTLSITVAQRTREFATLRTLGASRKQVMRSVVLEGLVIGLLASVIGLVLGLRASPRA